MSGSGLASVARFAPLIFELKSRLSSGSRVFLACLKLSARVELRGQLADRVIAFVGVVDIAV